MRWSVLLCALVVAHVVSTPVAFAQREYDAWYFGNGYGLAFQGGTPTTSTGSPIWQSEGCAVMCNRSTGALLFYSDGVTVWNRNHNPMPNGTGLMGHYSSVQAALVVPVPCDTNRYYLFTSDQQGYVPTSTGPRGINYSIIDMRLNGGLGDVVAGSKNIPLQNPSSERLTAVAHANGYDYWVLTHSLGGNTFYAFRVTGSSVSTTPVSSVVGANQGLPQFYATCLTVGAIKASPSGRKLAMTAYAINTVELFDFDPSTGRVTNPMMLYQGPYSNTNGAAYGVSFSPDNTKLYHGAMGALVQYDLLNNTTQAAIVASRTTINPTDPPGVAVEGFMQVGPDGKLYIVSSSPVPTVGVVNNPNTLGQACSYTSRRYQFGWTALMVIGLPNNIDARATTGLTDSSAVGISPRGPVTICAGGSVTFAADTGFVSYRWSTGSTSRVITVTQSGTYTVTVTNAAGCIAQAAVVLRVIPKPTPVIDGPRDFCNGDSIVLNVTQPFAQYQWSTGERTRQIVVRSAGTYRVTVTDTNGCIGDTAVTIRVHPNPQPQITGDLDYCQGERTTLDAGAGYAAYRWSTGDTTRMIAVRPAGTYWVTVTDGNGCTGSDTATTIVHPLPSARIVAPQNAICEGDSITLTAIDTGANAGAAYRWSTGETSRRIIVRTGGWVKLEVTTAFGCTSEDSVLITVNPNPTPIITIAPSASLCDGDSATLDAGVGYASYLWSTGERTQTIVVKTAGSYSVEVVDANGCRGVAPPVEIEVHPIPDAEISGPIRLCPNTMTDYSTGIHPRGQYIWSVTPGGVIMNGQGTNTISVQWSRPGVERVVLTVISEFGCIDTSSLLVTINDNLAPVITPDRAPRLCEGDSVTLDGGPGYQRYRWSTGETTRRIVVRQGGSYTLWVADSFGCEGTSDPLVVVVNPNPTPTITPLGDVDLCEGELVQLDAGAYASYLWSTGETSRTITTGKGGSYTVRVVDANGCVGVSPSIAVTVTPLPQPVIEGPRLVCRYALIDYSVKHNAGNTYVWRVTGGTILDGQGTNAILVKWGGGGTGTIDLIETTPNGCEGRAETATIIIGDVLQPVITANRPTTLCDGDSVVLDAGAGYNRYLWSTGESTQTIVVRRAGRYTVWVEGSNGCAGTSADLEIRFNPNPGLQIAGRTVRVCEGASVVLDAPEGYASYRWSTGETTRSIAVARPGVYRVEVTDANGCFGVSQGDTVVLLPPPPKPIISAVGMLLTSTPAVAYQWSLDDVDIAGATERTYQATGNGSYRVTITDENGCQATSDPYILPNNPPPPGAKIVHVVRFDTVYARVGERTFLTLKIEPPLEPREALSGFSIRLTLDPKSLYVHGVLSPDEHLTGEQSYFTRGRDGTITIERPRSATTLAGGELLRLKVEGLSTARPDNPVHIDLLDLHPVFVPGTNAQSLGGDSIIVGGHGLVILTGCDITHGFGAGKRATITGVTPNPVHSGMTVSYRAPVGSHPRLTLIDVAGRVIRIIELAEGTGGEQQHAINVLDTPSGAYMLEIRDGAERMNVPVVIVR